MMWNISNMFSQGKLTDAWEWESFSLDPVAFCPNRDYFSENTTLPEIWGKINRKYDSLEAQGKDHLEIARILESQGAVRLFDKDEISGFCKVKNNDYNALLVYAALVLISSNTNARISLSDEGDFLRCPVLIQAGLAKPWAERLLDEWILWEKHGLIKTNKDLAKKYEMQARLMKAFPDLQEPEKLCRTVTLKGKQRLSVADVISSVAQDNGLRTKSGTQQ